ncbi:MAG: carbohydrate ABC transporter permease [Firmicutes bacterium]|nr:carbohydrate ABC transporter permease [Bacillota bacterium]MDD4693751.1 carbohydrate ABC transporter permease [Bacillota bacterium]
MSAKKRRAPSKGKAVQRITTGQIVIYAILTIGAVIMSLPIVYMISTAFKPATELMLYPPRFLVRVPTTKNFSDLALAMGSTDTPFIRYMFNSAFVSTIVVVGTIILSTLAAYPLAKHNFPGRNFIFNVIVSALMISGHVTMIPRYLVIRNTGWIDTYYALIIPALAGSYGLFLMKQFIEPIPNEMLESAKMDGASEWKIFTNIILPLVKPAWATLSIFTFISTWNDFFTPLIMTKSDSMKTLPLAMRTISDGMTIARMGAAAAGTFLTTIPVILVFIFFQRYVVETMTYSGMKG